MPPASPQNLRPATAPTGTPHPFDQELCGLVLDTAPRLFAVVQVCDVDTELANGWVVAWGMAYDDGPTHVVSLDGGLRMSLTSPECALRAFSRRTGLAARLVWLAAPATAALDQAEAA